MIQGNWRPRILEDVVKVMLYSCCVNYFAFPMKLETELQLAAILVVKHELHLSRHQKLKLRIHENIDFSALA